MHPHRIQLLVICTSFLAALPTDASALTIVGSTEFSDFRADARDVEVLGDFAYVATSNAGMSIVDVSDPTAPAEIDTGALNLRGFGSDIEVVGGLAYLAASSGLQIVDVSDPNTPFEIGFLATAGRARKVEDSPIWLPANCGSSTSRTPRNSSKSVLSMALEGT